jgi:F-type H+-transporting ATPase subunit b
MADRAKKVQNAIDQAEKDKASAHKLLNQYEAKLKEAESQAEEILTAAHEDAEREAARIIAEGKTAAETLTANARKQIEAERQAALARFRAEAIVLIMAVSSRLAARELNSDDNRRFAAMLLDEMAAQKGSN